MEVKPPRFIPNNTQKKEKSHFFLFSLMSIRMEVNAARIKKGRAPKGAPQRGETAASMPRNFARQRTAGFPLPLDNFFRQLERNCENSLSHQFPQNRNKAEGDGV